MYQWLALLFTLRTSVAIYESHFRSLFYEKEKIYLIKQTGFYLAVVVLVSLGPQTLPDRQHRLVGLGVLGMTKRPSTKGADFLQCANEKIRF